MEGKGGVLGIGFVIRRAFLSELAFSDALLLLQVGKPLSDPLHGLFFGYNWKCIPNYPPLPLYIRNSLPNEALYRVWKQSPDTTLYRTPSNYRTAMSCIPTTHCKASYMPKVRPRFHLKSACSDKRMRKIKMGGVFVQNSFCLRTAVRHSTACVQLSCN